MADREEWREAVQEVWKLFQETSARFAETDARFKETDARLQAMFSETDARFREMEKGFRETRNMIKELSGLFTDRWGKPVEAMVKPNIIRLFRERGIDVRYVYQRIEAHLNGCNMEIDLLLEDRDEVVVVEVKSTLKGGHVRDFVNRLHHFQDYFPRYKGYRVYGAVAGLVIVEEADKFAYRQGLFVLTATGEGTATILNDPSFRPRNFAG